MASTPAVGPRPTTRTNTSAHTSSGTLRNTISSQRTNCRNQNGPRAIRPDSAEIESRRTDISASGIATTNASVTPAVAMATVRQVSRAIMLKNSALTTNGQKVAMNWRLILRLSGSRKIQGLNSVATMSGHSSTAPRVSQNTRAVHAGSRAGALRKEVAAALMLNGSASPQAAA